MANEVQLKKNVGDQAIERINSLCDAGFNMPADYNFVNAIKMSMLKLQELKDKNGKKALDVCTKASISSALFKMATKGIVMRTVLVCNRSVIYSVKIADVGRKHNVAGNNVAGYEIDLQGTVTEIYVSPSVENPG